MIDAVSVEQRSATLDTVYDITFAKQQFGEISPVLPGNAGNQCDFISLFHLTVPFCLAIGRSYLHSAECRLRPDSRRPGLQRYATDHRPDFPGDASRLSEYRCFDFSAPLSPHCRW